MSNNRCEFRHRVFAKYDATTAYGYPEAQDEADRDRCWITETVAFYLNKRGHHLCMLHAPNDLEPKGLQGNAQAPWALKVRGASQADFLTRIVNDWNADNAKRGEGETRALVLPKLQCGAVDLSHTSFTGAIDWTEAEFQGDAWFEEAEFQGDAGFGEAAFQGDAGFREAAFQGDAGFYRAAFQGDAWFEEAAFQGDAWFREAAFQGDAGFHRSRFAGPVEFGGCLFLGNLQLIHPNLQLPAYLTDCRIHRIRYRTHTGARLSLNDCRGIDLEDGVARDILTQDEIPTPSPKQDEDGPVTAPSVWDFTDQHAHLLTFRNMDLSRANFMGADLEGARFISCTWHEKHNTLYSRPYLDQAHENAALLSRVKDLRGIEATCRQVRVNLEKDKHFAQAGDFHFHEMEARRQILRHQNKRGLHLFLLWLYRKTADYGESYGKLLLWLFATPFIAGFLVAGIEAVQKVDGFTAIVNSAVPGTFTYAYTSFIAVLPFGLAKSVKWDDLNLYWLSMLTIGVGGLALYSFATLFVMALRRRFRR
ncbi:MAG: pentapeptide repeat-containing protein [Leptospirillia bacterium]